MTVYLSSIVTGAPTQAQETTDWTTALGTWKVGRREIIQKQSGDTKLVSNFDPVSGRHHVGLFSVGRQGWRNQRLKEAPEWIQHQRAIAILREPDRSVIKMVMSQNSTTQNSSPVLNAHAKPMEGRAAMEGRAVQSSSTSVVIAQPHPSSRYAQKLNMFAHGELLPRRLRMQHSIAHQRVNALNQVDSAQALNQEQDLAQHLLIANLEGSLKALSDATSQLPAGCASVTEFGSMLAEASWDYEDQLLTLMRTYACDTGIDAALVVSDLWQCLKRPGFSAARYPAALQLMVSNVIRMLRTLESSLHSPDNVYTQEHLSMRAFAEHLGSCGFCLGPKDIHSLQSRYCISVEMLKHEDFLADLIHASKHYFLASGHPAFQTLSQSCAQRARPANSGADGMRWKGGNGTENSNNTTRASTIRPDGKEVGRSRNSPKENNAVGFDLWTRPSTASDSRRPDSADSNHHSNVSTPGICSTGLPRSFIAAPADASGSQYFLDSRAILKQGTRVDENLRSQMAMVVDNIDNIVSCFRDTDVKQNKTTPVATAEGILWPFTRNLLSKDLNRILFRFSSEGTFRYEEFVEWCLPKREVSSLPPQLLGRVPTSGNYTISMRGGVVQAGPGAGLNAYRPVSSKNQLRMPPPARKLPTPSEWASTIVPCHV